MLVLSTLLLGFIAQITFGVDYFRLDSEDVLKQINNARTDPDSFADIMEEKYLTFQRYKWIIGSKTWLTDEGITGVQEAIAVLRTTSKMDALTMEQGLEVSAQVQANFLKNQEKLPSNPYEGCEGKDIATRISEIGKWKKVAESIIGGSNDAEDIVVKLLVSDGDPKRQTQKNILNPDLTQIGFGYASTDQQNDILVIHLADGFTCTQDSCPTIPTYNTPYNCIGSGFDYSFSPKITLSISLLLLVNVLYMFF